MSNVLYHNFGKLGSKDVSHFHRVAEQREQEMMREDGIRYTLEIVLKDNGSLEFNSARRDDVPKLSGETLGALLERAKEELT